MPESQANLQDLFGQLCSGSSVQMPWPPATQTTGHVRRPLCLRHPFCPDTARLLSSSSWSALKHPLGCIPICGWSGTPSPSHSLASSSNPSRLSLSSAGCRSTPGGQHLSLAPNCLPGQCPPHTEARQVPTAHVDEWPTPRGPCTSYSLGLERSLPEPLNIGSASVPDPSLVATPCHPMEIPSSPAPSLSLQPHSAGAGVCSPLAAAQSTVPGMTADAQCLGAGDPDHSVQHRDLHPDRPRRRHPGWGGSGRGQARARPTSDPLDSVEEEEQRPGQGQTCEMSQ